MARGGSGQSSGLTQATQRLIDVMSKLVDAITAGGGSGGGGLGAGAAAGGGAANRGASPIDRAMAQASAASPNMDALRGQKVNDFALSAARTALSGTGVGDLVSGFATGGIAGLGLAAVGKTAEIAQAYQGIHQAGREAARGGASFQGREAARSAAESQATIDFTEKYGSSSIFGFGFEYGKGFTSKDRAERGNDQVKRSQAEREEDRIRSGQNAAQMTEQQIQRLAKTGVFNADYQDFKQQTKAKEYVDALYKFNKRQAEGIQSAHRYVELIDHGLSAPNNQPKVGQ